MIECAVEERGLGKDGNSGRSRFFVAARDLNRLVRGPQYASGRRTAFALRDDVDAVGHVRFENQEIGDEGQRQCLPTTMVANALLPTVMAGLPQAPALSLRSA